VPGTWRRSIAALEAARDLGLETQINSTIGIHNRGQVASLARICDWYGVSLWSVFQLVPTGRATAGMMVTAQEHERVYRELAAIAADPSTRFAVKTTAGQPFYRVQLQAGSRPDAGGLAPIDPRAPGEGRGGDGQRRFASGGVNDGNGFVFISHTGEICPSGFLPLVRGDARRQRVAEVYRTDEVFVRLRRPDAFAGKCGVCEYNRICGGSRSRTWNLTGDPFGSDPTCPYQPRNGGTGGEPARTSGEAAP
jgi:MoaA/NifB/PqqE/SkfB family radical SAM enzyme